MTSDGNPNKYFDKLPGSNKFQCRLCKGRGTTDIVTHSNGKLHKAKALRDQAASPTEIGSEEEDVRPSNWQNFLPHPDDDDHDSINSEDEQDEIEAIPLCLENDDSDEVNKWYPVEKKEHFMGLLLMGTVRRPTSQEDYDRIQLIVKIGDLTIPHWASVRRIQQDLRKRLGLNVVKTISPLGHPCFSLDIQEIVAQELANPLVRPHLMCIPESATGTVN
ncbi:hypothetical protein DFH28DRAFT_930296 [Melampsora americana]|nr:hypothetical protein DFH28DRAFT_930296 [Melampsora americana]